MTDISPVPHSEPRGESRRDTIDKFMRTLHAHFPELNREDFCKAAFAEINAGMVIEDDLELGVRALLQEAVYRNSEALFREPPNPAAARAARAARAVLRQVAQAKRREKEMELGIRFDERVKEEAKTLLSDLMMTNGKTLRRCTGADCARLGGVLSPFFERLARKLRPRQQVGSVFNEEELKMLYETSGINHKAK